MRAMRACQLARGDGLVATARASRLPAVQVGANETRDVVVRGGRERGVAPCEFRHVQAARRLLLSRLAQRWVVGEEAGQADGRRSRFEIRGDSRKSSQWQADQGDDLRSGRWRTKRI